MSLTSILLAFSFVLSSLALAFSLSLTFSLSIFLERWPNQYGKMETNVCLISLLISNCQLTFIAYTILCTNSHQHIISCLKFASYPWLSFPLFFPCVWPAKELVQEAIKILQDLYLVHSYKYLVKVNNIMLLILISIFLLFFFHKAEIQSLLKEVCLAHNHIISLANQGQQVNIPFGQQKSTFPSVLHLYTSLA